MHVTRIRVAQDATSFDLTLTETGTDVAIAESYGTWIAEDGQQGRAGWIISYSVDRNFWYFFGNVIAIGTKWKDDDQVGDGPKEEDITSYLFLFGAERVSEGLYRANQQVGIGKLLAHGTLQVDVTRLFEWQGQYTLPGSNVASPWLIP